jgi:hypothetical protein
LFTLFDLREIFKNPCIGLTRLARSGVEAGKTNAGGSG